MEFKQFIIAFRDIMDQLDPEVDDNGQEQLMEEDISEPESSWRRGRLQKSATGIWIRVGRLIRVIYNY